VAAAAAEAEARPISSAAILVVVATAARLIRCGAHVTRGFPSLLPPSSSSAAALDSSAQVGSGAATPAIRKARGGDRRV
jgi:hypothetical protein